MDHIEWKPHTPDSLSSLLLNWETACDLFFLFAVMFFCLQDWTFLWICVSLNTNSWASRMLVFPLGRWTHNCVPWSCCFNTKVQPPIPTPGCYFATRVSQSDLSVTWEFGSKIVLVCLWFHLGFVTPNVVQRTVTQENTPPWVLSLVSHRLSQRNGTLVGNLGNLLCHLIVLCLGQGFGPLTSFPL